MNNLLDELKYEIDVINRKLKDTERLISRTQNDGESQGFWCGVKAELNIEKDFVSSLVDRYAHD